MLGLRLGSLEVHILAIFRTFTASSMWGAWILGSIMLSTLSLFFTLLPTHLTMSLLSPYSGSIGLFPDTSSISTTPKLYTSLFSFTLLESSLVMLQYSFTTLTCRIELRVCTSASNSFDFVPRFPSIGVVDPSFVSSEFKICFTANSFPVLRTTLYTLPEPPFPIRFSFLIPLRISSSVKLNKWKDFIFQ
nr:hypothetical protein VIGAN_02106900 [Ipomoea trifida]